MNSPSPELNLKLEQLRKELGLLDHALEHRLPDHKIQLAKINEMLRGQPELGGVMLDEDVHILMRSVIVDHGVQFTVGNKSKGAAKKLSGVELDNLEI